MKYNQIILTLVLSFFMACNSANYITVKHRKPINRNSSFNKKKDKRKKRVKYVKVKILKQSKSVKPPKTKNKEEPTSIPKEQHETDSTALDQGRN